MSENCDESQTEQQKSVLTEIDLESLNLDMSTTWMPAHKRHDSTRERERAPRDFLKGPNLLRVGPTFNANNLGRRRAALDRKGLICMTVSGRITMMERRNRERKKLTQMLGKKATKNAFAICAKRCFVVSANAKQ